MSMKAWEVELDRALQDTDYRVETKVPETPGKQHVFQRQTDQYSFPGPKLIQEIHLANERIDELQAESQDVAKFSKACVNRFKTAESKIETLQLWKDESKNLFKKTHHSNNMICEKLNKFERENGCYVTYEVLEGSLENAGVNLENRFGMQLSSQSRNISSLQEQISKLHREIENQSSPIREVGVVSDQRGQEHINLHIANVRQELHAVEKNIAWKILEETRSLDRRISECQQLVVNFVTNQTCRSEIAHSPILSTPNLDRSLLEELTKRIFSIETRLKTISSEKNSCATSLTKTLNNEDIMKLMQVQLQAHGLKTQSQFDSLKKEFEKEQITLKETFTAFMEENRKQLKSLEDGNKLLSQRVSELDEMLVNRTSDTKVHQQLAFLTESSNAVRKDADGLRQRIDGLDAKICDEFALCEGMVTNKLSSVSTTVASLTVSGADHQSRINTLLNKLDGLAMQLDKSDKIHEGKVEKLVERIGCLERSKTSTQVVQQQANQELEEARSRANNKANHRTNSAGSIPEPITRSASQGFPTVTKEEPQEEEKGAQRMEELANVRKRLADFEEKQKSLRENAEKQVSDKGVIEEQTNSEKKMAEAVKKRYTSITSGVESKTVEQLEKEAKRKEELAAVRKRLEQFEKKWKENNQTSFASPKKPQPGPPKEPPPAQASVKEQSSGSDTEENDSESESEEAAITGNESKQESPPNIRIPVFQKPLNSTLACQYCRRVLPGKNTAALHEKVCDKRPVNCKICSKSMCAQEIRFHENNCKGSSNAKCPHCDDDIAETELADHEKTCDWLPAKCTHCGMVIIFRDVEKHEIRCTKNPKSQKFNALMQLQTQDKGAHFEDWDTDQVLHWLNSVDGINKKCVDAFEAFSVDGCMLAEMEIQDLENEIGIHSSLDRKLIMEALGDLESTHNDAKNEAHNITAQLLQQS